MDSITHIVLGACVGEVIGGRKLGKKAMLFGALANSFPDIDVASALWLNQPDSFLAHRGFTHSILFALIITLSAGWMMKRIFSSVEFPQAEWMKLIGVNLFLHLLIDSFTAYGTGLFEPFNHSRISFHMVFVADPFFTLPLFVSAIVLIFLKTNSTQRKAWANAGLVICAAYVIYAFVHKIKVDKVVDQNLATENIAYKNFIATPTPLNNFLWYAVVDRDSGFNVGYYSVFDKSDKIVFHYFPKNDFLLTEKNEVVKELIRFSKGYYTLTKANDTLVFNDLRFGQIGGWYDGDAPFIFQYRLLSTDDSQVPFQQGRMKASSSKAFKEMIERIKGN